MPSPANDCHLPALPDALRTNAQSDSGRIYLTVADWAALVQHDVAMRAWIQDAMTCLEVAK